MYIIVCSVKKAYGLLFGVWNNKANISTFIATFRWLPRADTTLQTPVEFQIMPLFLEMLFPQIHYFQ